MATVTKTKQGQLSISGDLTLEEVEDAHRDLLAQGLSGGEAVDLSGLERFDLPGLQLLYALNREERTFSFGQNGPRLAKMARFAGLTPLPGSQNE